MILGLREIQATALPLLLHRESFNNDNMMENGPCYHFGLLWHEIDPQVLVNKFTKFGQFIRIKIVPNGLENGKR